MARRYGASALVVALLLIGGVVVSLGDIDQGVDLSSALETWGDVLRDADQFGLQLTRVSDREEMEVGQRIARLFAAGRQERSEWGTYVSAVGDSLLPHIRRKGIRYQFHVIDSPHVNAFALPGGQVFILTGMLEFLQSEAELAAILGHEISHVDLRHCIERYQYAVMLKRVGLSEVGQLADLARRLVAAGYGKYQELEADAHGVRLSIEAEYNPEAGAAVFERLKGRASERTPPKPTTPIAELAQTLEQALSSYHQSHPLSEERLRRLNALLTKNRERLSGRAFYIGVENYQQRIPRSQQELPSERRLL